MNDFALTVEMFVTEAEAARQLSAGKHVKVHGNLGTFVVVPYTSNRDTHNWRYGIFRDAPILSTKDEIVELDNDVEAITRALKYSREGVPE